MSSRVLRKLQGEKELNEELSDVEQDLPVSGGAKKKQLSINRYDLLNEQSLSESEVKEDDNETEANNAKEGDDIHESMKRRKKKKKKKSGKHATTQRSSEDNADVDEVERSVKEVNRLLGETYMPAAANNIKADKSTQGRKGILSLQHKHLNANNELKRIFGSKIVQTEHKRKNRCGRSHARTTWLVSSKDNWPQVGKTGLSMKVAEQRYGGVQYFAYDHSQSYRQVQNKFLLAVESLNPGSIVEIINEHPYHVDALIQMSDLFKMSEDLALAAEVIEKALYSLECAFHPLFNIAAGTCRLDYKIQENRALFITIFKHLLFVGGRACYRTALEFCKLLLSLDPDGDPLAVKLAIDFFALRSKEYAWLVELATEWENTKNLSQLPNFAFSIAMAHFHLSEGDTTMADQLLQDALIMFPAVLTILLEKCSIQIDNRVKKHTFFDAATQSKQSPALTQLILLYVNRNYHLWKEPDLLPWLERNVHVVLDRVDNNDPLVKEYEAKRLKRYHGPLPRSICRHIILSDIKGVTPLLEDYTVSIVGFDPLPPPDSINIYNKPKRPKPTVGSNNAIGIFFRSLLPTFNTLDIPDELVDMEVDGARALPYDENGASDAGDLRSSVASLVGAMRNLLSNIRLRDVPNDADVDESDDTGDDDEINNYLT